METVILNFVVSRDRNLSQMTNLKPFREISDFQTCGLLEFRQIDKKLMSNPLVIVLESQAIMTGESVCHVVGI